MSESAPLLNWPELQEIQRLGEERARLQQRISTLKPHAAKKLELRGALKVLTEQQLRLETKVRR